MVKCEYCEYTRAKETGNGYECTKCGIRVTYPRYGVDLHQRRPVPLWRRLVSAILFKLYYLSVHVNRRLEGEVRKPRLGMVR